MARSNDRRKDELAYVWEKRLTGIVVVLLIGYIASVAGEVKTKISVIEERITGSIAPIVTRLDIEVRQHDLRLSTVEIKVSNLLKRK